ncbi:hypothetical protein C8J57DRAFT_1529886 [Mycena rebaudengoi]|nr:hypothetical protein C8J57DRAFT_1529886 [Mycena rebaudengoi]
MAQGIEAEMGVDSDRNPRHEGREQQVSCRKGQPNSCKSICVFDSRYIVVPSDSLRFVFVRTRTSTRLWLAALGGLCPLSNLATACLRSPQCTLCPINLSPPQCPRTRVFVPAAFASVHAVSIYSAAASVPTSEGVRTCSLRLRARCVHFLLPPPQSPRARVYVPAAFASVHAVSILSPPPQCPCARVHVPAAFASVHAVSILPPPPQCPRARVYVPAAIASVHAVSILPPPPPQCPRARVYVPAAIASAHAVSICHCRLGAYPLHLLLGLRAFARPPYLYLASAPPTRRRRLILRCLILGLRAPYSASAPLFSASAPYTGLNALYSASAPFSRPLRQRPPRLILGLSALYSASAPFSRPLRQRPPRLILGLSALYSASAPFSRPLRQRPPRLILGLSALYSTSAPFYRPWWDFFRRLYAHEGVRTSALANFPPLLLRVRVLVTTASASAHAASALHI